MTKLYCYRVARDFGFAPNPFWGVCTLACCKPDIRRSAQVGDWVVGAGASSAGKAQNRVVFGMRVTETMTFDEYWNNPRFECKKPVLNNSAKYFFGDNIYHGLIRGQRPIQEISHHSLLDGSVCEGNLRKDTKTNRILISEDFIYFGENAPCIPAPLVFQDGKRFPIERQGYINSYSQRHIQAIVAWLRLFKEWGVVGLPEEWKNPYVRR